MAETTPQSRAAAFVVAGTVLAGIVAGVVVPKVVTHGHVEYGEWPDNTQFDEVKCVEGTVYIADGPARGLGQLPTVADSGGPYCTYRACYTPAQIPQTGQDPGMPDPSMDALFAEAEVPFTNGWPPLAVWCGPADVDTAPMRCACAPKTSAGTCEKQVVGLDGNVTWVAAQSGESMSTGIWRGDGCVKMPCGRLAGKDDTWLPAACVVPHCEDRSCGSDGAGGSCGTCGSEPAPITTVDTQLTCDSGAGRCCAVLPCTPARSPFPADWTPPPYPGDQ
jgi:hypothetical protein